MKVLRYFILFLSILIVMLLQACGGGGSSDTAGSLTLSDPTVTDGGALSGVTYSKVTVTATYTPPSGKSAQGVLISITASYNGIVQSDDVSLTSGSNSVVKSFLIPQNLNSTSQVIIVASIGGMKSGVLAIVPKATPPALEASFSSVTFLNSALANSFTDIAFTGGVFPYAVSSSVPDIVAAITNSSTSGGNLRVTLINAAVFNKLTSASLSLSDKAGGSVPITVKYFK